MWAYSQLWSPVSLNGGSWANAISPDGSKVATFGSDSLVILNSNGTIPGFSIIPLPYSDHVHTITWQHQ